MVLVNLVPLHVLGKQRDCSLFPDRRKIEISMNVGTDRNITQFSRCTVVRDHSVGKHRKMVQSTTVITVMRFVSVEANAATTVHGIDQHQFTCQILSRASRWKLPRLRDEVLGQQLSAKADQQKERRQEIIRDTEHELLFSQR